MVNTVMSAIANLLLSLGITPFNLEFQKWALSALNLDAIIAVNRCANQRIKNNNNNKSTQILMSEIDLFSKLMASIANS